VLNPGKCCCKPYTNITSKYHTQTVVPWPVPDAERIIPGGRADSSGEAEQRDREKVTGSGNHRRGERLTIRAGRRGVVYPAAYQLKMDRRGFSFTFRGAPTDSLSTVSGLMNNKAQSKGSQNVLSLQLARNHPWQQRGGSNAPVGPSANERSLERLEAENAQLRGRVVELMLQIQALRDGAG
jgi:hypothetical protein